MNILEKVIKTQFMLIFGMNELTIKDVFLGKLLNTSTFKRLNTKGFIIRLALST